MTRPARPHERSTAELVIVGIAAIVMLADAAVTILQFVGDCESLVGMFFWIPVLAVWIVGVLLPAGWRLLKARLGRIAKRAWVASAVLTAIPPLLATVMPHPHMGHCIS